ncbi:hypothetical protein Trydic_g14300 [Trypoxylus dichotomus]
MMHFDNLMSLKCQEVPLKYSSITAPVLTGDPLITEMVRGAVAAAGKTHPSSCRLRLGFSCSTGTVRTAVGGRNIRFGKVTDEVK